jgi:CubicO group peptidase (beta-lactamase class C family)
VYEPLGLRDTWLPRLEPHAGALPTGYMGPVVGWKHSAMFGTLGPTTILDKSTAERSAGGLAATARDALRFLSTLMERGLLPESTLRTMLPSRPILPLGDFSGAVPTEKTDAYGRGLARMRVGGRELVGHGGLYNGHAAGLWYLPECRLTVVVYANRGLVNMRSALAPVISGISESPACSRR